MSAPAANAACSRNFSTLDSTFKPNFALSHSPAGIRVNVSGLIPMTQTQAQTFISGGGYYVHYYLWGDDLVFDDRVSPLQVTGSGTGFSYSPPSFPRTATTQGLPFQAATITIPSSRLNEDNSFGDRKDEIYAVAVLNHSTKGPARCGRSNVVTGYF
jgi:hypothetical protein